MTDAGEEEIQDILASAAEFEVLQTLTPEDELNLDLALLRRNDLGNAQRLNRRFSDRVMHVREIGWFSWTGSHWERSGGDVAARLYAHQTAVALQHEVKVLKLAGRFKDESLEKYQKRTDRSQKWATNCGNTNRLTAMLREAEAIVSVDPEVLDCNPHRLTLANGTLHLGGSGDMKLLPHDPADRITRAGFASYNRSAGCPVFERFLERIMPDPEVRAFLQRYAGYMLTGETGEQLLVLLYGLGANGKSVLVSALAQVLGTYAMTLPFASLLHDDFKRGSEASPDLARLPGARMVAASEPDVGVRISESIVKSLTGGEPIAVRKLHRDFFEFTPAFKLMLSFNNRPQVRGQDEGVWRRIMMVPFEVTIPRDERDPRLLDWSPGSHNPLAAELPGILNWMLDGFEQWAEIGLVPPEAVTAATEAYRSDQDPVRQFLAIACKHTVEERVQSSRLYAAYVKWCKENAVEAVSQTKFGRTLNDLGFKKETVGVVYYLGIEILPEYDPSLKSVGEDETADERG